MIADKIAAYWMWDNHTFSKLSGTIEQMVAKADELGKKDKYGSLCPIFVLCGNKELRRVGRMVHWPEKNDLSKWIDAVTTDPDISRLC